MVLFALFRGEALFFPSHGFDYYSHLDESLLSFFSPRCFTKLTIQLQKVPKITKAQSSSFPLYDDVIAIGSLQKACVEFWPWSAAMLGLRLLTFTTRDTRQESQLPVTKSPVWTKCLCRVLHTTNYVRHTTLHDKVGFMFNHVFPTPAYYNCF